VRNRSKTSDKPDDKSAGDVAPPPAEAPPGGGLPATAPAPGALPAPGRAAETTRTARPSGEGVRRRSTGKKPPKPTELINPF
jgi:hypothetical protein